MCSLLDSESVKFEKNGIKLRVLYFVWMSTAYIYYSIGRSECKKLSHSQTTVTNIHISGWGASLLFCLDKARVLETLRIKQRSLAGPALNLSTPSVAESVEKYSILYHDHVKWVGRVGINVKP